MWVHGPAATRSALRLMTPVITKGHADAQDQGHHLRLMLLPEGYAVTGTILILVSSLPLWPWWHPGPGCFWGLWLSPWSYYSLGLCWCIRPMLWPKTAQIPEVLDATWGPGWHWDHVDWTGLHWHLGPWCYLCPNCCYEPCLTLWPYTSQSLSWCPGLLLPLSVWSAILRPCLCLGPCYCHDYTDLSGQHCHWGHPDLWAKLLQRAMPSSISNIV